MHRNTEINIIDVRDLVDKAGNRTEEVRRKINEGCDSLRAGKKTVVCCDYGISRSNAIAVGILAMYEGIPFESAVRRVLDATDEREIKVDPLQAVRLALGLSGKKYSKTNKQQVMVTGGTGFIGRPVIRRLTERYEVLTPPRSELDLELGSTQLDLLVGENDIDCIVHLANPRIYTSNVALGDTLTMLRNVLEICISRNVALIYLSSWEVYSGYRSTNLFADESLPLFPKGPYAETKFLAEILICHFRKNLGLKCTILRSGPVYGIESDKPKFIYNFIDKIKRSETIVTHRYRNGDAALDLLYIDDLVHAVEKAVCTGIEGDFNIGSGIITPVPFIAKTLLEITGATNHIDFINIDEATSCISMDFRKAHILLGWKPNIDLKTGLQSIIKNT